MQLINKVALVTGAGRGWGRSICLALAKEGALVVAASRTQAELDETAGLVSAQGGHIETMRVDIGKPDEIQRLAGNVLSGYGRLDVLVNNAAQLPIKPFEEMTMGEFEGVLGVNLIAPIALCKRILPAMKAAGGGSIINVSSNAGAIGFERESAYCTSKFALEGFSKCLAMEVKLDNIAVNTITPGGFRYGVRIKPTSLTQEDYERLSPEEQKQWVDSIVMCEAFVYLACQDGSGVTGQRILAYELSEQIRREGWKIQPCDEAVDRRNLQL
jgi:NAD(P)-dependent dehydrogenase (short-subunit alcohol dehydrogenase family)